MHDGSADGRRWAVARVTSVLLKGGERREGDPLCWAEVGRVIAGTYHVHPIRFECEGTFSLNAAIDRFEIMPVDEAPPEVRALLNRQRGPRRLIDMPTDARVAA